MKPRFGLTVAAVLLGVSIGNIASAADITFFEGENFRGRNISVETAAPNFEQMGINDRASSVQVRGGSWQVCSDSFFRGKCVTLPPGDYPSLRSAGLDKSISSAREVGWASRDNWDRAATGPGDRGAPAYGPQGYERARPDRDRGPREGDDWGGDRNRRDWGSASRAILYSGPNLSGRAFVIDNEVVGNLDPTGFNDRAESIRIEGGYWVFCSDSNFQGECRTFGPGDYPALDSSLNNRISSGRRVSNNYPYAQRPRWER